MNKFGLIMAIIPLILYIAGGWYSHKQNKRKE
jgi:hypothetical protein